MTSWNENLHARSSNGRFTEMAGSAPEGALAVPSIGPDAIDSVWGSFTEPDLPTRARQRESAMKTLWASETALTVLSAQEVAVRVREEHPDAVGLRISESWEPGATSWALDSVVLADGSALQVSDELTDDIATPVSDIRPEGNEPWFRRHGEQYASFSFNEVLALTPPAVGAFVPDARVPAPRTAADRAAHVMSQGWVDLPAEPRERPDEARSAVADAMTDLVHFARWQGFDVEAVFGDARARADEEVRQPF